MRSRPKIPRSPISSELRTMIRKENESMMSSHSRKIEEDIKKKYQEDEIKEEPIASQDQPVVNVLAKENIKEEEKKKVEEGNIEEVKKKPSNDPMTKTQEFRFAFASRSKIVRSPASKEKKPGDPSKRTNPAPNNKKR